VEKHEVMSRLGVCRQGGCSVEDVREVTRQGVGRPAFFVLGIGHGKPGKEGLAD